MTLKVFIVEDSDVVRDCLSDALEELAPVNVVGSAAVEQAAVQWLLHDCPGECDLLVVDLSLERGSGLGVLRACQGVTTFCKVVFSNHVGNEMKRRCSALGADRVFDKSNEIDALIDYCVRLEQGKAKRPGG